MGEERSGGGRRQWNPLQVFGPDLSRGRWNPLQEFGPALSRGQWNPLQVFGPSEQRAVESTPGIWTRAWNPLQVFGPDLSRGRWNPLQVFGPSEQRAWNPLQEFGPALSRGRWNPLQVFGAAGIVTGQWWRWLRCRPAALKVELLAAIRQDERSVAGCPLQQMGGPAGAGGLKNQSQDPRGGGGRRMGL
ncbi:hypothetical protein F7725_013454, partial [Dissostichus mawsoni]